MTLSPKRIYKQYIENSVNKVTAVDLLISFIENCEDITIIFEAIEILEKVEANSEKIFKFFENLIISDLNYKMPAEWNSHQRTFVAWPIKESMCFKDDYESVCKGYREIVSAILEFEPVTVISNTEDVEFIKKYKNE